MGSGWIWFRKKIGDLSQLLQRNISGLIPCWCLMGYLLVLILLEQFLMWYYNIFYINPNMEPGNMIYCLLYAISFYFALCAPVLLLGKKLGMIYGVAATGFFTLFFFLVYFLIFQFKMICNGDLLFVLLASSPQECGEFVQKFFDSGVLLLGITSILAFAIMCYIFKRRPIRRNWFVFCCGVVLLMPFSLFSFQIHQKNLYDEIYEYNTLKKFVSELSLYSQKYEKLCHMARSPELPAPVIKFNDEKNSNIAGVIVLGESASRHHMSIYGYSRETTPELDKLKDDLLIYDNVISAASITSSALRYLLTWSNVANADDLRCSIVDIFRAAGYRVVLISNQYRSGEYDSPVSLLFSNVDKAIYLKELKNLHDDEVLQPLQEELNNSSGRPVIVFVHFIGSHILYQCRYPETFGPFDGVHDQNNEDLTERYARDWNSYDNSIAFSDQVLGKIAEMIRNQARPGFMLYVSDHGEIIGDVSFRNSRSVNPNAYEIPFVLYLNDAYKLAFPEFVTAARGNLHKPLQTDNMMEGFAALGQVNYDNFDNTKNIFSCEFIPPATRYMRSEVIYPEQ